MFDISHLSPEERRLEEDKARRKWTAALRVIEAARDLDHPGGWMELQQALRDYREFE